jgi:uncharacterized protein (DUF58 family)
MSHVSRLLDPNLIERLNHLQLSARRVVEGSTLGQHKSPVKGASVEFRQHRFYTPGDEPRRLDWRVLARTDRPYIKEFDEETNLRCVLMLDASGSMAYRGAGGAKFDYAATLAASLAYLMLKQTESVGLAVFKSRVDSWIGPHAGQAQLARIVDVLERSGPGGQASLRAAVHDVANRLDRRALVIVISDLFYPVEEVRECLARLRHDRHETILLRTLDADELAFPFRTGSRFRGLEGERTTICEPALVRDAYLQRFRRHRQDLADGARALGGEFHTLVSDRPLVDSLTAFLRTRGGAAPR